MTSTVNDPGRKTSKISKKPLNYRLFMYHAVTSLQLKAAGELNKAPHRQIVTLFILSAKEFWGHKLISLANQLDGHEWQAFILQLLYLRYGADLIEVPDEYMGDHGIEAFSLDGCAFQCYAPEGPHDVAALSRKHKRKITRDLNKFKTNRKELLKIFGAAVCRSGTIPIQG